jgi:hypothetical protein
MNISHGSHCLRGDIFHDRHLQCRNCNSVIKVILQNRKSRHLGFNGSSLTLTSSRP